MTAARSLAGGEHLPAENAFAVIPWLWLRLQFRLVSCSPSIPSSARPGTSAGARGKASPTPRQEPLGNCRSRSKAVRVPDSSATLPDRPDLSTLAEPGGASPPCGLRTETGTRGSLLPTSGPSPCCNPDLPCDQRLWTLVRLVHVRPQGSQPQLLSASGSQLLRGDPTPSCLWVALRLLALSFLGGSKCKVGDIHYSKHLKV